MFVFGAFAANAGLGFGIASLQAVTKRARRARGAPDQSLQNVGINLACALFFGFLYKRDEEGRERQMIASPARGASARYPCAARRGQGGGLYDLRDDSSCSVVVAAGDAESLRRRRRRRRDGPRDRILERGVLVVCVVRLLAVKAAGHGAAPVARVGPRRQKTRRPVSAG